MLMVVVSVVTYHPPARPAAGEPAPPARQYLLEERPGSGAPATYQGEPSYNACAILNAEVLQAAGLRMSDGFLVGGSRLSSDGDRPNLGNLIDEGSLRRPGREQPGRFRYHRAAKADHVNIDFTDGDTNIFKLSVTDLSAIDGAEEAVSKLIDGITKNIASGPKPMPEYSYPAPYDAAPKPCDAFPPEIFTTITGKPTDGFQKDLYAASETRGEHSNAVDIRCDREAAVALSEGIPATVTVGQTIYAVPDQAPLRTKEQCDYESRTSGMAPLPTPIGDASCGTPPSGHAQILFHKGRAMIRLTYTAGSAPSGDLTAAAQQIYDLLPD